MADIFADFRGIDAASVLLRLGLAMVFGGMLGLERGRKRQPAGFRTYMLVCLGAALTMILGQYEAHMFETRWSAFAEGAGVDVARFGAQVINGIGFLGAGTIIVTGRQEVKGLTTAAGLWASACMGLAIGAGFYECILLGLLLIFICARVLPHLENLLMEKARNMNISMEFESLDCMSDIIACMKRLNVHIYDIDIDRGGEDGLRRPKAVFALRLMKRMPHSQVLAEISKLDSILMIEEI